MRADPSAAVASPADAAALAAFVADNFDLPRPVMMPEPSLGRSLRDHLRLVWPVLARGPDPVSPGGSQLAMPTRHLVPGGRFRELYYWDSYFSMLGLVRDGHAALAERPPPNTPKHHRYLALGRAGLDRLACQELGCRRFSPLPPGSRPRRSC